MLNCENNLFLNNKDLLYWYDDTFQKYMSTNTTIIAKHAWKNSKKYYNI